MRRAPAAQGKIDDTTAGREMEVAAGRREMDDVAGRLAHMDELEIDIQVLYPTAFLRPYTRNPELELVLVGSDPVGPIRRWTDIIVPTDPGWYSGKMKSLSGDLYMGDYGRGNLHRFVMNRKTQAAVRKMADALRSDLADFPPIFFAGYTQDSLKEFVEANVTCALILNQPLQTPEELRVEEATYLNGLAETRLLGHYNDVARAVASSHDVQLIDLARLMPKDSRYFIDFIHFSNEGAAMVGRLVAGQLAARFMSGDGG